MLLRPALGASLLLLGAAALALLQTRPPLPGAVPFQPALSAQRPRLLPSDFPLDPERDPLLFSQLDAGDRSWQPRAEPIPGGGIRYVYRRQVGDPPLTLEQIKALIRQPPSFMLERQAIRTLLQTLRARGVRVVLGPPRQRGAAGEWEPRSAVLRIRPDVPGKGSHHFALVLNHEAIHVAQSCRRGHLHAEPQPLGLSRQVAPRQRANLAAPIYAGQSPQQRRLEEEAYANQQHLSLGWQLLQAHCRH